MGIPKKVFWGMFTVFYLLSLVIFFVVFYLERIAEEGNKKNISLSEEDFNFIAGPDRNC
jgi:uncharacterized membrane protein